MNGTLATPKKNGEPVGHGVRSALFVLDALNGGTHSIPVSYFFWGIGSYPGLPHHTKTADGGAPRTTRTRFSDSIFSLDQQQALRISGSPSNEKLSQGVKLMASEAFVFENVVFSWLHMIFLLLE